MGHDAQWAIQARSITSDLHAKRSSLPFDLNQTLTVPINTKFHENPHTRCRDVTNAGTNMAKRTAAHFFFATRQKAENKHNMSFFFLKRGDIFD
jgi:hypothetical protein